MLYIHDYHLTITEHSSHLDFEYIPDEYKWDFVVCSLEDIADEYKQLTQSFTEQAQQ